MMNSVDRSLITSVGIVALAHTESEDAKRNGTSVDYNSVLTANTSTNSIDESLSLTTNQTTTLDDASPAHLDSSNHNESSRSYISRFARSWRVFAQATDIAKREKLRRALKDALVSVDAKKRTDIDHLHEDINSRIRHAATLLKQFREMYELSDHVKRSLTEYKTAKRELNAVPDEHFSEEILKKFLSKKVMKRTNIPTSLQLDRPEFLRKTEKIALKAVPLDKGEVGMEFSSVDSRTSSVSRAMKAFKAAKVILNFVTSNKRHLKNSSVHGLIGEINKGIDRVSSDILTSSKRRSGFPKQNNDTKSKNTAGNSTVSVEDLKTILNATTPGKNDTTPVKNETQQQLLESLSDETKPEFRNESNKTENTTRSSSQGTNLSTSDPTDDKDYITSKLYDKINPFVELLKKFGTKNFLKQMVGKSNGSSATKKDITNFTENPLEMLKNVTAMLMNTTLNNDTTVKLPEQKDGRLVSRETLNQIFQDEEMVQKQQYAMRRLKEAKIARQKYEIAKHELAQKVKELYELANDFEKQETDDQILEVKKSEPARKPKEEKEKVKKSAKRSSPYSAAILKNHVNKGNHGNNNNNVVMARKRSDDHPGIAMTGILHHGGEKRVNTPTEEESHKGFTMGMKDKTTHQVKLEDEAKARDEVKPPGVSTVATSEDLVHWKNNNSRSPEETLKVIAQAIQDDMKEISKDDLKAKTLLAANRLAEKSSNIKENTTKVTPDSKGVDVPLKADNITDSIDEYLTKALSQIMANDSNVEMKESKEKTQADKNRKIVEKAMRAHASNPDANLPLLNTKGDKIIPTKDAKVIKETKNNKTKNSLFQPQKLGELNNRDTPGRNETTSQVKPSTKLEEKLSKLDENDPNNKALLDKATKMEEQVAAAQEKLYEDTGSLTDPPPVHINKKASKSEADIIQAQALPQPIFKQEATLPAAEAFPGSSASPAFKHLDGSEHDSSPFMRPRIDPSALTGEGNAEISSRGGDPYGSIKEPEEQPNAAPMFGHTNGYANREEDDTPEPQEDDEEDGDEEDHSQSRHRSHHHYAPDPEEEESEDEEDDDDDDDRYPSSDYDKRKRTLQKPDTKNSLQTPDKNTANFFDSLNPSANNAGDKSVEFPEDNLSASLEDDDSKKSIVPDANSFHHYRRHTVKRRHRKNVVDT